MIAVEVKRLFMGCPKLGRCRINDKLLVVSHIIFRFAVGRKSYHTRELGDNPKLYLAFLEVYIYLLPFYEGEDLIVSQLRSKMIRRYLVEEGILLQRLQKGIFCRSRYGASEICSDICQASKVTTTMRCGEKDKTFR